jgi:hypothetical protein
MEEALKGLLQVDPRSIKAETAKLKKKPARR